MSRGERVKFTVRDTGDLRAVTRALRHAEGGQQLRRELVAELRREIRPIVARVKASWRSAPSNTPGRSKLRRLLANATRGQVRLAGKDAGVRIRTDGRKMPARMKSLPTLAEGTKRPWRHPVYGDRAGPWVVQQPFGRFYATVQPDAYAARRDVERAVEDVFKRIARAR
jgi:hypothetical protein